MKQYFGSIGIDFVAKNYAMGGSTSGEEISLCIEEIFGKEIDSLSWDFGQNDAGEFVRLNDIQK